jgi:hypothetical protein
MDLKVSSMKFLRLILLISTIAVVLFVLSGCSNDVKSEKLNWTVNVLENHTKKCLESNDSIRQYDGSISEVNHYIEPISGNVFLLVHLDLKKNVTGNHPFVWKNFYLKDSNNQVYHRGADIFLKDFKFKRIAATNIKLDSNGWICFEIPQNIKLEDLKMVYVEGNKEKVISLK